MQIIPRQTLCEESEPLETSCLYLVLITYEVGCMDHWGLLNIHLELTYFFACILLKTCRLM